MVKSKMFPFGILKKVLRPLVGISRASRGKAVMAGDPYKARRLKGGRFPPRKKLFPRGGLKMKTDGAGNQHSGVKHGPRPMKLSKRMKEAIEREVNPINHEIIQGQGRVLNNTRGIGVFQTFELNQVSDVDDIITKMASTYGGVALDRAGKLHLHNSSMEVNLTNQSNTTSIVRIYEYIARRDVPAQLDINGVVSETTQQIVDNGFGLFRNGATNPTSAAYGVTLFQNPLFCTYYKIKKVRDTEVAPGKVLTLTMGNTNPKLINCLLWDQVSQNAVQYYTRGYIIQVRQAGVNVAGVSESGAIDMEYQYVRRYQWTQSYDGATLTNITDGMTHSVYGTTGAQLMNQNTAAIASESLA